MFLLSLNGFIHLLFLIFLTLPLCFKYSFIHSRVETNGCLMAESNMISGCWSGRLNWSVCLSNQRPFMSFSTVQINKKTHNPLVWEFSYSCYNQQQWYSNVIEGCHVFKRVWLLLSVWFNPIRHSPSQEYTAYHFLFTPCVFFRQRNSTSVRSYLFPAVTVKHELILAQTSLYYIISCAKRRCVLFPPVFFLLKCFRNWQR